MTNHPFHLSHSPNLSSIFALQSPSFPYSLLLHLPYSLLSQVSMFHSLLSVQIPWPLCAPSLNSQHMDSSGICCILLVHSQTQANVQKEEQNTERPDPPTPGTKHYHALIIYHPHINIYI